MSEISPFTPDDLALVRAQADEYARVVADMSMVDPAYVAYADQWQQLVAKIAALLPPSSP